MLRHILFIFLSLSTIVSFYFLLDFLTTTSILKLFLFTLIGVLGFLIQKRVYHFFVLEFKFIYKEREIQLPKALKIVRDTGMDLAFILILAAFGVIQFSILLKRKNLRFPSISSILN